MLDPVIRPIPSSDAAFARAADAALTELADSDRADQQLGPALVAALRPAYPNVVVRPIERQAGGVPDLDVWYAFRDGDGRADEGSGPGAILVADTARQRHQAAIDASEAVSQPD